MIIRAAVCVTVGPALSFVSVCVRERKDRITACCCEMRSDYRARETTGGGVASRAETEGKKNQNQEMT